MKRVVSGGLVCVAGLLVCSLLGCTRHTVSSRGSALGSFRLTVYWLASERRYRGPRRVSLYFDGLRVARVSRRFAKALRMQGSGRLRDGNLVQYVRRCRRSRRSCLRVRVINQQVYPMGVGAAGIALQPLRSLAADRRFRFGSSLYIPALARLLRQRGHRHNGCFVVHDRGGRIRGNRIDLFTGSRQLFRRTFRRSLPSRVKVYADHPRCTSAVASR